MKYIREDESGTPKDRSNMKYPKHLSPKQRLLRLLYVNVLSIAKPMEEFATWLLAGVAAILGAVIVNVAAVSSALSSTSLRWGLAFLVVSLLTGVVSKQIGAALCAGMALAEEMYGELESPNGSAALEGLAELSGEFKQELSSAFLPPLRGIMKRSFERGSHDALAGEKRFTKLFCIQLYSLWAQNISSAVGLLILAFGIKP